MMSSVPFRELPRSAAWRHREAREGFESVNLRSERGSGYQLDGTTAAVEDGHAWAVRYRISLDERWITKSARIWCWSQPRDREMRLEADGSGSWQVDGVLAPEIDGCFDVDLESSSCTNTIPVHRLQLGVGQSAEASAAYVRALDLGVKRIEQRYSRVADCTTRQRYDYRCPDFDFEGQIVYDEYGLVVEYPGIASRVL